MHKFKTKLLYRGETFFCTKTELSNFKITLPLGKLDMVSLRLVSIFFIISDDIPNGIPLVTFLLLSNIRKLSIRAKVGNSDNHHCL